MEELKHKFDESVENLLAKIVVDDEYRNAQSGKTFENAEFESILDKFECKHTEANYSWMSNIEYPIMASIIMTDISGWVGKSFQSRDFTEVKLEGVGKDDPKKCAAAKKCINQTLNNRNIYHFTKYVRGRTINALAGQVFAVCWWEQKTSTEIVGYENKIEDQGLDELGQPIRRTISKPQFDEKIAYDRFNYDFFDSRNVFTDSKYVYSPQQKDWITFRSEKSFDQLESKKVERGYFNLDLAKKLYEGGSQETETSKETYLEREINKTQPGKLTPIKYLDHLLRFGKIWAIVKDKVGEDDDYPKTIIPGYDEFGEKKDKAVLIETIMEFVIRGTNKVLIRFQPQFCRDTNGNPYKPICRGLCYIHPTKDVGMSSGKFLTDLQTAVSDHFNMGADRVKLATLPTMKGNIASLEDNTTLYFEPEHIMMLNDTKDIEEFKISDNIDGTINMISMLENAAQRLEGIFPTTMGELPGKASTTATAVAGAGQNQGTRENYKDLTWTYTFDADFYWMILQMTWQFARPKTALKMMGDDAYSFDPDAEYTYVPVSSNIETEANKYRKLQLIDQFIGRLVNVPNPNTFKVLNYLLGKTFALFGDEFPEYKDFMFDEKAPMPMKGDMTGQGQVANASSPTSNQTGTPMSTAEQMTRGVGV
jgi:hypothetical protein